MSVEFKIVWHTFFCDVCHKPFYQEAGKNMGHFFQFADIMKAYKLHEHGKELREWKYYNDLNKKKSDTNSKEKCRDCNTDLTGVRERMTISDHYTHEVKGYQCMDCFFKDEEDWH